MRDGKSIAIVPGSFDPITYGHIDVVKRAAELFDIVYLAVMVNSQKQYLFTMEQREAIARTALEDIPSVKVISSVGMLWRLALELNADAIVKGYRNETDLEYEQKMAEFNSAHNPHARTVLLKADKRLEALSSTEVRRRLGEGKPINDCMPQAAADAIEKILSETRNK